VVHLVGVGAGAGAGVATGIYTVTIATTTIIIITATERVEEGVGVGVGAEVGAEVKAEKEREREAEAVQKPEITAKVHLQRQKVVKEIRKKSPEGGVRVAAGVGTSHIAVRHTRQKIQHRITQQTQQRKIEKKMI